MKLGRPGEQTQQGGREGPFRRQPTGGGGSGSPSSPASEITLGVPGNRARHTTFTTPRVRLEEAKRGEGLEGK